MVFSSVTFLAFFLPCLLGLYYIIPRRYRGWRNFVLLFFSVFFYAWGGLKYLGLLSMSIAVNYLGGVFSGERFGAAVRKAAMIAAVAVNLSLLGWFKYSGFFAQIINDVGVSIPIPEIVLPIGISFFTFQGLSYVLDVYRGTTKTQKNPLNVALYVALFPQLVAGPIVRYTTVEDEILGRKENFREFTEGAIRFSLGLGKKMLLANAMAEVADLVFSCHPLYMSVALAWVGAIAYTFQIYFDFSAYSDMAIGLGRMFGFHFLENFNYPYIAKSVTEFWRRWHISLSSFFRDYVYIPLGGNRCSRLKHIRNMAIVWALTGLWHGAAWTFVAWGIWFGVLLIGEKYLWAGLLEKMPKALGWVYTLLAVVLSWVLFRSATLSNAVTYIGAMFGIGDFHALWCKTAVFQVRQYLPYFLMCIVGACPVKAAAQSFLEKHSESRVCALALEWGPKVLALAALGLSYMKLATGSFNPFIYFQF